MITRHIRIALAAGYAALFLASVACGSGGDATPTPFGRIGGDSSISGQIKDEDGKGMAGVTVTIVSATVPFPEVSSKTDADGFYTLGGLAAGTYDFAVFNAEGERIHLDRATAGHSRHAERNIEIVESRNKTSSIGGAMAKPKTYSAPPPMTIDPSKSYTATFHMEEGGEFVVELYPKEAPVTVNSFVFLATEGFYDGVTFHRVLPGFMAQGGDPTGTGTGGPGYKFESELSPLRRHDGPGVLSMANAGGLATNGSQFFITFVATPALDGHNRDGSPKSCASRGVSCHTVFGKVTEGLDVVMGITPREPATATSPGDVIRTITIDPGE